MKRFFMDDRETVERWGRVCGMIGTVILWAAAVVIASGILA